MYASLSLMIEQLLSLDETLDVLTWASPVPFFGRIDDAQIATVGINPSIREFIDRDGTPLAIHSSRLETLTSLNLNTWLEASGSDVRQIAVSCSKYFEVNPYRRWFDVLDRLLGAMNASFYLGTTSRLACHIDLVPFTTKTNWGSLPNVARQSLLASGGPAMARLLRDSNLQILILNGRSVVAEFEKLSSIRLSQVEVDSWTLPRRSGNGVPGYLYTGVISEISGFSLDRKIKVLGYNHNLQSSYGVTSAVLRSIGHRLREEEMLVKHD